MGKCKHECLTLNSYLGMWDPKVNFDDDESSHGEISV